MCTQSVADRFTLHTNHKLRYDGGCVVGSPTERCSVFHQVEFHVLDVDVEFHFLQLVAVQPDDSRSGFLDGIRQVEHLRLAVAGLDDDLALLLRFAVIVTKDEAFHID